METFSAGSYDEQTRYGNVFSFFLPFFRFRGAQLGSTFRCVYMFCLSSTVNDDDEKTKQKSDWKETLRVGV